MGWWPVAVLVAYTLAVDFWIASHWSADRSSMTALGAFGAIPAVAAALLLIGWLVRRHPMARPRRTAWASLLFSYCLLFLGSAIWAFQVATGDAEVGGLGDLIYWLSFPLMATAMALFFLDVGGSFRQPIVWLDAATLAVAIGVAMWEFVVRPSLLGATSGPGASMAAAVYAASFVLTMVFACLAYMQVTDWNAERALVLLAAGALANALAECFSGGETPTTLAGTLAYNTAYLVADTLVVAAVIVESRRDDSAVRIPVRPATATSTLPALALLLAVTTLIILHVTPQATDIWVTISIALLGAALVTAREISARYEVHRRHRERAMREAEERLTELIRRSTDVIAVVAPDGRLSYVSPAAHRVLGLKPEDLLGLPATALVGAANSTRLTAYLEALGSGRGNVAEVDFEIARPSGERRIIAVIGSDQRASVVIGGIALTLRDASVERRAERAMLDDATRERQALSSEVHEGIAQELTGVALLIQSLRATTTSTDAPVAREIQPILEQLGQTIGSARRLAATLSPVHVAGGSLALAVQQLAAEIGGRTGIEIVTQSQLDDDVIPEILRDDAYRIVRAALVRAGRDATCTRVSVELETTRGELAIALSGDGNRLAPDPAGEDCELMQSIMHRVQRLRGSLSVERPGSQGARLVVQLPLEATAARAGGF